MEYDTWGWHGGWHVADDVDVFSSQPICKIGPKLDAILSTQSNQNSAISAHLLRLQFQTRTIYNAHINSITISAQPKIYKPAHANNI
jgi:hypothetical protein